VTHQNRPIKYGGLLSQPYRTQTKTIMACTPFYFYIKHLLRF